MAGIGSVTAGAVVAHISALLKEYTSKTLNPKTWREIINAKSYMIQELMADKDRAIYKAKAVLTEANPGSGGIVLVGDNATYTNSTRTVYIPAGVWSGGGFTTDITDATDLAVGSPVIIHQAAGGANLSLITYIESITNATSFVVKDAYGVSLGAGDLQLVVHNGADTSEAINISSLTDYAYIDQILSIHDSGIDDECINAETLANFRGMKKKHLPYNFSDSIIYCRDGQYVYFAKGSDISSYGTRTMYYSRKPYPVSSDSDYIDLPDSELDMLYKLCMLQGLQTLQVPIPAELQSAMQQFAASREAKKTEIDKLILNQGDN